MVCRLGWGELGDPGPCLAENLKMRLLFAPKVESVLLPLARTLCLLPERPDKDPSLLKPFSVARLGQESLLADDFTSCSFQSQEMKASQRSFT